LSFFSIGVKIACRMHADEIDRLAPADLEGQQRAQVGAEDHPERARRADRQRQQDAPVRPLTQKRPGESAAVISGVSVKTAPAETGAAVFSPSNISTK
jgi:hypothetical protein